MGLGIHLCNTKSTALKTEFKIASVERCMRWYKRFHNSCKFTLHFTGLLRVTFNSSDYTDFMRGQLTKGQNWKQSRRLCQNSSEGDLSLLKRNKWTDLRGKYYQKSYSSKIFRTCKSFVSISLYLPRVSSKVQHIRFSETINRPQGSTLYQWWNFTLLQSWSNALKGDEQWRLCSENRFITLWETSLH